MQPIAPSLRRVQTPDEIYRARLMRKDQASNTGELVHKLMAG